MSEAVMELVPSVRTWIFYPFLFLLAVHSSAVGSSGQALPYSNITCYSGHYPYTTCKATNFFLDTAAGVFFYRGDKDDHEQCQVIQDIWTLKRSSLESVECDETYDQAYTFLFFYFYGSNMYHLVYDTMIPLYQMVYHNKPQHPAERVVFMPAVETARLQAMDWDTKAFADMETYWVETLQLMAGKHTFLPMNRTIRDQKKIICFKNIAFGGERVDYKSKEVVQGFSRFVLNHYNIKLHLGMQVKIGLISRKNRRKILNEDALVEAVKPFADIRLVEFSGLTFRQQVELASELTVLVGMNGAGLMNALYLPPHAVAVQLAPYNNTLNVVQFGEVLKARGPYMVWSNTHEENHFVSKHDVYSSRPDTLVHVEEFKQLMKDALVLAHESQTHMKDEL